LIEGYVRYDAFDRRFDCLGIIPVFFGQVALEDQGRESGKSSPMVASRSAAVATGSPTA
jgi:hypothetical protein